MASAVARNRVVWMSGSSCGGELYISIGNMVCVGNPWNTSEANVVKGSNPILESSG